MYKVFETPQEAENNTIPLAVLGDSDSHIYHDPIIGIDRGGPYHEVTYQWTEILDSLRPHSFDMGEKGAWGARFRFALFRHWLGLEAKSPRKFDYRYNYAISGLGCDSLLQAWPKQAFWLIANLKNNSEFWNKGIIVIRIGINDIGQMSHLREYARTGLNDDVRRRVQNCTDLIDEAVEAIREANNNVGIVIVGVADNTTLPRPVEEQLKIEEIRRIRTVLNYFDNELVEITDQYTKTIFMDDRRWFLRYWPDSSDYSSSTFSDDNLAPTVLGVSLTKGDHPRNLVLSDGHAGTVVNGLWAREFINLLNREFSLAIPPLSDDEIANLADPSHTQRIGSFAGKVN